MKIETAFKKLLYTRGTLTSMGCDKRAVYNYKQLFKKGSSPEIHTMRKWLLLAGYTYEPEKWKGPKSDTVHQN